MSGRPSFRNPISRWGTKDGAGGSVPPFSPSHSLDPGPSRRPFKPQQPSPESEFKGQTGRLEGEGSESLPRGRRGSLARIKDVGRAPAQGLRNLVRRWAGKRPQRSGQDSLQRVDTREVSRGPAPPRPPRPKTIHDGTLELVDAFLNAVQDHVGLPAPPGEVAVGPIAGSEMNRIAFPKVVSTSPFEANRLDKPQSVFPRSRRSPPRVYWKQNGSSSQYKVGVSSRPPITPPPANSDWTVAQRNNIRIPRHDVPRWLTGGVLGTGGFGRVYLVYNTATQEQCAMKVVNIGKPISGWCCRGIINELKVLARLDESDPEKAPFLLLPYLSDTHWAWRSSRYLHILTAACMGGDLLEYKGRLSSKSIALVCAEVVRVSRLRLLPRRG